MHTLLEEHQANLARLLISTCIYYFSDMAPAGCHGHNL